VHKKVFTVYEFKSKPPFGLALDRGWLGFFQYTTGSVFANNGAGARDPFGEYGSAKVFDPRAEWLLRHQDARPYGDQTVLSGESGAAEGGEGAGGAAGAPAGGARPGDPKIIGPAVGGGVVVPQ
jgi:hypothetical protein